MQSKAALTTAGSTASLPPFRLFGRPPLRCLASHWRIFPRVWPRRTSVLALVAFCWLPMLVLSAFERRAFVGSFPFLVDYAIGARMLVELPLLVSAKGVADQLAGVAVSYLIGTKLVPVDRRERCEQELREHDARSDSWLVALGLVVLGYALSFGELSAASSHHWWKRGDAGELSLAGLWYYFVARPLLLTQLLSWLFAFVSWTTLLRALARLPLRLNAFHPDGAGGLAPVVRAHGVFMVLAFALAADVAGAVANRLGHEGEPINRYLPAVALFVAAVTLLLLAPLGVFSARLVRERLVAMGEHGAMSHALASRYERECVKTARQGARGPIIELISAHADGSTSGNVVAHTRVVPITRNYLIAFVAAGSLPFVIASLTRIPLKEVAFRLFELMAH